MKTYVLTVSRFFPSTHRRKGEEKHCIDKKMLFKEQCELMPGFQHYSPGRAIAIPPYLAEKNFLSCFFKLTQNLTPAESSIQAINTHSPDK